MCLCVRELEIAVEEAEWAKETREKTHIPKIVLCHWICTVFALLLFPFIYQYLLKGAEQNVYLLLNSPLW